MTKTNQKKMQAKPAQQKVNSGRVNKKRRPRRKAKNLNRGMMNMSVSAPAALGTVTSGVRMRTSKHIEGPTSELLTTLTIPQNVVSGTVLMDYVFNPTLMINSRLRALAAIYGQYRFQRLFVDVLPACSTGTDGQITLAIDKNITYNPLNNSLGYAMGISSSSNSPIWERVHLTADTSIASSRQRVYLTDPTGDVEESVQFRLLAVMSAPITTVSGGATIILKIGYTVEFDQPINTGVDTSLPTGIILIPPGNTVLTQQMAVDGSGVVTYPTGAPALPTGKPVNGTVYAVNPVISGDLGGTTPGASPGLAAGVPPIAAFVLQTLADGSAPILNAFSSISAASSVTGQTASSGTITTNGDIPGTTVPFGFCTATYLIPVDRVPITYHV